MLGEIAVDVTYQRKTYALTLYVVQENHPPLLARSWLQHIWLDWRSLGIATIQTSSTQQEALLKKYEAVFEGSLGSMHHFYRWIDLNQKYC